MLKNTSEKNNSNSCRRIGGGAGLFLHTLVAGDAYWWTVGSIRTLVTKCPTILINNAGLWHVVHFLSVAWWSYDEVSQIFYYLSLHFSLLIFMMIFRGILAVGLRGVRTQSNFCRLLLDQEFIVIVKWYLFCQDTLFTTFLRRKYRNIFIIINNCLKRCEY